MFLRNFWFFAVAIFFIFDLMATIAVFKGDYGTGKKVVCVVVLVIIFFWLLPRFMSFLTDIMAPRIFRGRKIFVEQSGGEYDMLRIVDSLNSYFLGQGAIITDDSGAAEFQITLSISLTDPTAISCRLTDQRGYTITFTDYGQYWPRSFALAVARFIRMSDRHPVNK